MDPFQTEEETIMTFPAVKLSAVWFGFEEDLSLLFPFENSAKASGEIACTPT